MHRIALLYEPSSDGAVLTGGAWQLPLANLQTDEVRDVVRSQGLDPSSTQMDVTLQSDNQVRAILLGPLNVSSDYSYRVRSYAGSGRVGLDYDSGWVSPSEALPSGNPLDIPWEDPWWWMGHHPYDDEERGVWLIHVLPTLVSGQFWSIEISDPSNAAGYVEAGRLFMARGWVPSINFDYGGNGLSFRNNSVAQGTLNGGKIVRRRFNPRVFRFSIPILPEDEGYREALRMMRVAGFDREVFVIPNPEDQTHLQHRSFHGRFTQMDPLTQTLFRHVGVGFEIEEIV